MRIRQATAVDAQLLCAWWNDGQVMAHAGFPHGLGIRAADVAASLAQDGPLGRRCIVEVAGVPIGEMSYRTPAEKTAQIGIKICDARQQNKGYGTAFLKLFLRYLFVQLAYERIILDTNLHNERAQVVYARLGFRKTGVRLDSWQDQTGVWQSSVDYEMTRTEYLAIYGR